MSRSALQRVGAARFDPIGPSGRAVVPLVGPIAAGYGRAVHTFRSVVPVPPADANRPSREEIAVARARRPATIVRIRRIRPADHDGLRDFYAGLSDESRRTRFLGATSGIGENQSTYFCTPDHAHREGFVAVIGPVGGRGRIVGHVCIEPANDSSAEVAVAVADAFQRQGIGRRLVDAAVAWARLDGIRTLVATMLGGNPAIQRLLTGLGLPTVAVPIGAGIIEVRIDLGVAHSAA